MVNKLANFMVFRVKDTGEKEQIEINEEEFSKGNGSDILTEKEVLLIVKESIRRIYIWKGIASSVRRKFIGSQVASELQKELMTNGNFHRCKIVSVDQGDELEEFLNNFNLKSPEGDKLLKKREKIEQSRKERYLKAKISHTTPSSGKSIQGVPLMKKQRAFSQFDKRKPNNSHEGTPIRDYEKLVKNLIQESLTDNYIRKHLIVGDLKLYGMVEKKAKVFNEDIKQQEWEPIKNFPKEIIDLKNYRFRLHVDTDTNQIKGIEVLENIGKPKIEKPRQMYKFSYWTVSKLRKFCKENDIDIPTGARKDDIISLVKEFTDSKG